MKRLKRFLKGQRGFTLVELLIAMTIGSLVVTSAIAIMAQLLWVTPRNSSYAAAFTQVQNAGNWISRDALMAQEVNPDGAPDVLITLQWTVGREDGSGDTIFELHQAIYTLEGSSGELGEQKELRRAHSVWDTVGETFVLQDTTLVAEYIDPSTNSNWDDTNKELIVIITAQVGEKTATRTYGINPRPLS